MKYKTMFGTDGYSLGRGSWFSPLGQDWTSTRAHDGGEYTLPENIKKLKNPAIYLKQPSSKNGPSVGGMA